LKLLLFHHLEVTLRYALHDLSSTANYHQALPLLLLFLQRSRRWLLALLNPTFASHLTLLVTALLGLLSLLFLVLPLPFLFNLLLFLESLLFLLLLALFLFTALLLFLLQSLLLLQHSSLFSFDDSRQILSYSL
jgi:hypothetical protein